MTTLDFSKTPNLNDFDGTIGGNLDSLTSIYIGDLDVSNWANNGAFYSNPNNSSCTIYASTIEMANALKTKKYRLSNWSTAVG